MTALDTMTIIWGLKIAGGRHGNLKQPDLLDQQCRARILLEILDAAAEPVLLSTVSLAEVLVGIDQDRHEQFVAVAREKFFCPPFDLAACALAAKLWLLHAKQPAKEQLSRKTLKADVQIIATAASHGAKRFFSSDKKARKLAELAGIESLDLPSHHPDKDIDARIRQELKR